MFRQAVLIVLLSVSFGGSLGRQIPDGRIVGGEDVDIEDYSYQLSLEREGIHVCGASILNDHWVITSAHCLTDASIPDVRLRAGSSLREEGGSLHQTAEYIIHENWDANTIDNDIALIKVVQPFDLQGGVLKTVTLPSVETPVGTLLDVTGWGLTQENGERAKQLQHIRLPVFDHERCVSLYEDANPVTENMVCAGLEDGGKGPCQTDSGGAAVVDGTIVGIVSWGLGCARPRNPAVFTDVLSERDWILSKID